MDIKTDAELEARIAEEEFARLPKEEQEKLLAFQKNLEESAALSRERRAKNPPVNQIDTWTEQEKEYAAKRIEESFHPL
ncbi:MAG: hypothetical protein WC364_13990 [Eubacteriales bacterium]|jgi:hypothetical protein